MFEKNIMQYIITLMENKYFHIQVHLHSLCHAFEVILNTLNGIFE